jgi:hypothetical protein
VVLHDNPCGYRVTRPSEPVSFDKKPLDGARIGEMELCVKEKVISTYGGSRLLLFGRVCSCPLMPGVGRPDECLDQIKIEDNRIITLNVNFMIEISSKALITFGRFSCSKDNYLAIPFE